MLDRRLVLKVIKLTQEGLAPWVIREKIFHQLSIKKIYEIAKKYKPKKIKKQIENNDGWTKL